MYLISFVHSHIYIAISLKTLWTLKINMFEGKVRCCQGKNGTHLRRYMLMGFMAAQSVRKHIENFAK